MLSSCPLSYVIIYLVEVTIATNCNFLSTRQIKLRNVEANLVIFSSTSYILLVNSCINVSSLKLGEKNLEWSSLLNHQLLLWKLSNTVQHKFNGVGYLVALNNIISFIFFNTMLGERLSVTTCSTWFSPIDLMNFSNHLCVYWSSLQ